MDRDNTPERIDMARSQTTSTTALLWPTRTLCKVSLSVSSRWKVSSPWWAGSWSSLRRSA